MCPLQHQGTGNRRPVRWDYRSGRGGTDAGREAAGKVCGRLEPPQPVAGVVSRQGVGVRDRCGWRVSQTLPPGAGRSRAPVERRTPPWLPVVGASPRRRLLCVSEGSTAAATRWLPHEVPGRGFVSEGAKSASEVACCVSWNSMTGLA